MRGTGGENVEGEKMSPVSVHIAMEMMPCLVIYVLQLSWLDSSQFTAS